MKVTVMLIVIGALGTVIKVRVRGQHYWDRPEYWEMSQTFKETYSHLNSCKKPSANAGVKISQKRKKKKW